MNKDEQSPFNRFFIPFHNLINPKPMRKINRKMDINSPPGILPRTGGILPPPQQKREVSAKYESKKNTQKHKSDFGTVMDSISNYRFL